MPFFSRLLATAAPLALAASAVQADVVISSAATQNMTCGAGVCAPTAASAVLNVGDLENLLASGNVEVTTTGSGVQATNIAIDAPLSWSASSTLALDAYQSISVGDALTVAGMGGLTVTTNDGGKHGTFSFGTQGSAAFENLSSPLTVNGVSFTLVGSLPALAAAVKNNPAGSYALANNYDASQDGTYNACPIDTLDGTIEGLGNTISNLSIHVHDADAAMVEVVDASGVVQHLHLAEVLVQGSGKIGNAMGGLVGQNNGYVFGDSVGGTVAATGKNVGAGGLVATNDRTATISSSWADAHVKSLDGTAGGLTDENVGAIEFAHADGDVDAFSAAGGLVGENYGAISQSFATATVKGAAGGLVGGNISDGVDTGTIENSYSTGRVNSGVAGGFVEDSSGGPITTSYSIGAVRSGDGGFGCSGGNAAQLGDDYWDTTTSGAIDGWCGDLNIKGNTGLTSRQLRRKLPHGFDKKIWAENPQINNGYPYLIANPPPK